MLKEFHITNFKCFGGTVRIPLKPITLIFGPNSSGKSSIFQSLLLVKQTVEAGRRSSNTGLITNGDLVDLGTFKDLIFNHDESLSFTFKANFKAHSIEPAAILIDPVRYDYMPILHKHIELLEKCSGNEQIGIGLSFSFDPNSSKTMVSYVDLYIGEEHYPLITYKRTDWGYSSFEFRGNFRHKFWKKYWEIFDSEDPEKLKEILKKEPDVASDPIKSIIDDWKNMSKEDQEAFMAELKKSIQGTGRFPEIQDQVQRINPTQEPEKNVEGNFDFGSMTELYGNLFQYQHIGLKNIFPRTIGNAEIWDLISDYAYWDQSRDPSIFLISAGAFLEDFIKHIEYIAPLRNYPDRYYRYRGKYQNNVGLSGEMVPDILFDNQELISKVNSQLEKFGPGLRLELSRMRDEDLKTNEIFSLKLGTKSSGATANIRDVGFGFSQVLPVIVQCIMSIKDTILIEQPELHLHPALQADLADVFIHSALAEGKNKLLIESHSEHLLLRIMRRMRETNNGKLPDGIPKVTPEDICVLFVEQDGHQSIVREMPLNENGELVKAWPGGFFEEGLREVF